MHSYVWIYCHALSTVYTLKRNLTIALKCICAVPEGLMRRKLGITGSRERAPTTMKGTLKPPYCRQ